MGFSPKSEETSLIEPKTNHLNWPQFLETHATSGIFFGPSGSLRFNDPIRILGTGSLAEAGEVCRWVCARMNTSSSERSQVLCCRQYPQAGAEVTLLQRFVSSCPLQSHPWPLRTSKAPQVQAARPHKTALFGRALLCKSKLARSWLKEFFPGESLGAFARHELTKAA